MGGNNKISMPKLKLAFEKQGFENVITYINSGNIIFDSDVKDELVIKIACEELIKSNFGLNIAVCIINATDYTEALNNAPTWWDVDKESKHNAIFVIPPMVAREICEQAGETKPEYEKVVCYGRVIFWSAPLATFSRTRWSKIVQNKAMYNAITIRNSNTTRKLAEICSKPKSL